MSKYRYFYLFRAYNEITPTISLSGPTNFAPLIYEAIAICERVHDVFLIGVNMQLLYLFLVSHFGDYCRRSGDQRTCHSSSHRSGLPISTVDHRHLIIAFVANVVDYLFFDMIDMLLYSFRSNGCKLIDNENMQLFYCRFAVSYGTPKTYPYPSLTLTLTLE